MEDLRDMAGRISIKDLKRVAVDGFASTLTYVLAVGDEIGRARALQILARLIGERKIMWGRENLRPEERGNDAMAALNLERQYTQAKSLPGTYKPRNIEVVEKNPERVLVRHRGFCVALEACKRLGLKTSDVCPIVSCISWEMAYRALVNPRATMKITKLRPEAEYCEEIIEVN